MLFYRKRKKSLPQYFISQERKQMCLNCAAVLIEWPGRCPVCGYQKSIVIAPENALSIKAKIIMKELYG